MRRLPDAIIIVDAQYEDTAIREAKRLDIPVIAIVDSNTDPNKVDIPIPANDDSIRTIQLIISALADAVNEARESVADKDNKKENKKVEVNKTEAAVELKDSTKESSPKNGAETAPIIEAVVEDSPDKKESKEVDESPGKDEK
jgi:small subunit ribosomal protein S2